MTTTNPTPITLLTPEELRDDFCATGNSLDELKTLIQRFNLSTKFVPMNSFNMEIISSIQKDKTEGVYNVVALDPHKKLTDEAIHEILSNPALITQYWQKRKMTTSVDISTLMNEWVDSTKIAFSHLAANGTKEFYFTTPKITNALARYGLSGEALKDPTPVRNMYIAENFDKALDNTAVVRSCDKNCHKIFYLLSEKYTHVDQMILFDIIKEIEVSGEMGECNCHSWDLNHTETHLLVEFPKKAEELSALYALPKEMIPGILINTSDTGSSSFAIQATWRPKGSNSVIITDSEVKRKHIGEINVTKIIKDVSNVIFSEYAALPEALCNLITIDITDPSWDLKTPAGVLANKACIENTLKEVFKQLGVVKAIGKKTEKLLREAMVSEIDPVDRYTAYDICMLIMSLPERVHFLNENKSLSELQKVCGQAPFTDYSKKSVSVVLT